MNSIRNKDTKNHLFLMTRKTGRFDLGNSIDYWESFLLNRTMHLIDVRTNAFPADEFKKRLLLSGMCCIRRSSIYNNIGVYWATPSDCTGQYYDRPLSINYNSNTGESGTAIPGSDCVFVKNTSIALPVYPLISRYAIILSHTDISIINTLVSLRAGHGVPVVNSDSTAKSVKKYYTDMFNGNIGAIVDEELLGVELKNLADKESGKTILDLLEARNNVITMYFNDIGVQSAKAKKGNMLTPEIESDMPRLLLSLNEMMDCWQEGAKECKELFNIDVDIDLSEEMKVQFSSTKKNEGGVSNEN